MTTIRTISLVRGDDYGATITFDQPIAGFSAVAFTVREAWATDQTDNTDAIFEASLATSGLTPAGNYAVDLEIGHADTVTWTEEKYVYDIQVTTLAGKIYTTQRGQIRMIADATR